ncbi:MAG: hypothetical protein HC851_22555 [Acaryochloris sp. RU_4_1]|nr:hypothetical protein [Acaryochloris sp. RU_4_1]NJR56683.1 hypothetical protein [Acaryochloris sp. CRU_2_0]
MTSTNPQRWTDDRLDALAASTQSLLEATQANTKSIERMIENQLAMQTLHGQVAEQTLQLKRAVDYLLSKDGGQS